jgi:hypothetical protein
MLQMTTSRWNSRRVGDARALGTTTAPDRYDLPRAEPPPPALPQADGTP